MALGWGKRKSQSTGERFGEDYLFKLLNRNISLIYEPYKLLTVNILSGILYGFAAVKFLTPVFKSQMIGDFLIMPRPG